LAAARLERWAGNAEAASGLLTIARTGLHDERHQAFVDLLTAQISIATGPGLKDPAPLLDAARKLEAYDRLLAQETYLEAYVTALRASRLGPPGLLADTARELAKVLAAAPAESPTPPDLMLEALITRALEGYAAAAPSLRRVVAAFLARTGQADRHQGWAGLAAAMAMDLWEHDHWRAICERQTRLIRRKGELTTLPGALHYLAYAHILAGEFRDAEALIAEAITIDPTGNSSGPPFADLLLRAWRGDQGRTAALIEQMIGPAHETGEGHYLSVIDGANAVLYNGIGRYNDAFAAAVRTHEDDEAGFSSFIRPELVEAAARSGRHRLAEPVLEHFTEQTNASGADLAIGLQLYARALLTDGPGAEDLYRNAISKLARTRATPYFARAHLVYGEWLRREARRGDARIQLRIAYENLSEIGAAGFTARAARELSACGERPNRPAANPIDLLTPQEHQIARLVAAGATSKEVAEQLYVSPRTVHAHLRSIFKKLEITSRLQLRDLQLHSPDSA
jgi:DNA-binding CsgD family transcriptional regulator/tetratricopeptide (TPR) repeat protein